MDQALERLRIVPRAQPLQLALRGLAPALCDVEAHAVAAGVDVVGVDLDRAVEELQRASTRGRVLVQSRQVLLDYGGREEQERMLPLLLLRRPSPELERGLVARLA
ncbi:MAG TPA: hypothetical protein DEA08_18260 [Planctomycetes bacterium]|nr:hypothetical protein [Planctomycetota bacterium]